VIKENPVSIPWQILFTFISFLDLWAFYRIKRLRKALLFVYLPSFFLTILFGYLYFANGLLIDSNSTDSFSAGMSDGQIEPFLHPPWYSVYYMALMITSIIFQGLEIYLIIKWSKEWNHKLDHSVQAS